ncbi:MAG: hypothetical protein DHS20C13_19840 [Thermodesulfobacteriota bacterium]|nr:MAG: hypothetical protein DHS20C13_19840 [Thermodesulfobacteriota bacterium]
MAFQEEEGVIKWKIHFNSSPQVVYEGLANAEARAKYWAESAEEKNGVIEFRILGYSPFKSKILDSIPGQMFKLEYFGSIVMFNIKNDGNGGTDMQLIAQEVDRSIKNEMTAGWVSVLMAMKAALDFGVDLRNHDIERTWMKGYADN